MRIIGGHDYYDSGLAFGQDDSVVFVRDGTEMFLHDLHLPLIGKVPLILRTGEKKLYKNVLDWHTKSHSVDVRLVQVVFCGHYYSGVRVTRHRVGYYGAEPESEVFWDEKSLDQHLRAKCDAYIAEDNRKWHHSVFSGPEQKPFASYKLEGAALDAVIEKRVVLATRDIHTERLESGRDDPKVRVNGDSLKAAQFFRVKDAWTAFQEISMFVGGVLPAEGNRMVSIADESVRIHKAGFDPRTAFRNPIRLPGGRKQRRKVEPK
jgi:hypothetical protein